jgi:hypothetical protein
MPPRQCRSGSFRFVVAREVVLAGPRAGLAAVISSVMTSPDRAVNDPAVKLTVDPVGRAGALADWWEHWERLPRIVRDRPVADVLAEQRDTD